MHKCKFAFCEEEKLYIIFTGSILSLCFCQISYILHKPSHERWVCSSVSLFWGGGGIIYKWRQFLLAIELKSRDLSHFAELKYMVLVEQGWRDMIWGFLRPERVKTLSFSCSEDKVSFKSGKICLLFQMMMITQLCLQLYLFVTVISIHLNLRLFQAGSHSKNQTCVSCWKYSWAQGNALYCQLNWDIWIMKVLVVGKISRIEY